jgi:hypothetical protein
LNDISNLATLLEVQQFPLWKKSDTMEERIGRIRQIETDFFFTQMHGFLSKKSKKIRLDPLNPPNPFSHCIAFFQSGNC